MVESSPKLTNRIIDLGDLNRMQIKGKQKFIVKNDSLIEAYWEDNTVVTTKYTLANFVPKNLFLVQFAKLANIYFLIITMLQVIPSISISNNKPVMAVPLIGVLFLSMAKDAWEDYSRY